MLLSASRVLVPFPPNLKWAPFFENVHMLATSGNSTSEHHRHKRRLLVFIYIIDSQIYFDSIQVRTRPREKNDNSGISKGRDRFDIKNASEASPTYWQSILTIIGSNDTPLVSPGRKLRKRGSSPNALLLSHEYHHQHQDSHLYICAPSILRRFLSSLTPPDKRKSDASPSA